MIKDDKKSIEIINEYLAKGATIREVADQVPYSKSTVALFLKNNGMRTAQKKKTLSKEDARSILDMYNSGLSLTKIYEKTGFHPQSTSYNLLKWFNVGVRGVYKTLAKDRYIIIDLYNSGVSIKELCKKYKCSQRLIRGILIAEEIDIRPGDITVSKNTYNVGRKSNFYKYDYFDEMNFIKAVTLGIMYSSCDIPRLKRGELTFYIKSENLEAMEFLASEIMCKECKNPFSLGERGYGLTVSRAKIIKGLKDRFGFPNEIKLDSEYIYHFIQGIIIAKLNVHRHLIKFYLLDGVCKDLIINFLINIVGIDKKNIKVSKRTVGLRREDDIKKLVKMFDVVGEKITKSSNYEYWSSCI